MRHSLKATAILKAVSRLNNNSRAKKAEELFKNGYNCAQAVAVAFADLTGMDEDTVAKLTSGYGGGIGRMREVCGSISGMVFIMNCLYGYNKKSDGFAKSKHYKNIQSLAKQFEKENGSVVCRELLGLSIKGADSPIPELRTPEYYKKRPCSELVYCAADILEKYIKEKHNETAK